MPTGKENGITGNSHQDVSRVTEMPSIFSEECNTGINIYFKIKQLWTLQCM